MPQIIKTALKRLAPALLICGVIGASANANALTVQFDAIDLVDNVAGEDLWEIRYSIDEFPYGERHSLTIFFDEALYTTLEAIDSGVVGDWDVLTLQPDPLLPADGIYDAFSLVDNPTVATPFIARFIWLGGPVAAPGSQDYRVDAFSEDGFFLSTVETGITIPVPEPSTALLIGLGLCGIRLGGSRNHHENSSA